MSTRDRLDSYIQQLEARLRLGAILRGGAILTSVALAATVVLVLIANAFAFSSWSLTSARVALLLAMAFAIGFGLAIPLYGLDRRRAAGKAEAVFPQFQQRLVTFAERNEVTRDPFMDLLAADTLDLTRDAEPSRLVTDRTLLASLCAGVASLGVLVWLIVAGPGYLGHGASLLWTGSPRSAGPLYALRITPGDAAVRRNADQVVTAQLTGLQTTNVHLYARYQSASKWEQVNMQPQPGKSAFQFLFAGLPEDVEYYVEAGPLSSRHFKLRVVDLPAVKQIRVTYHFPSWTGLPVAVEEHGGDLRAVEGTQADLEITMDRPMRDGVLALDDNTQLRLAGGSSNVYKGTVQMDKDGQYHVAALDQGQPVRLSEDYFIEARKANPPDVRLTRPGSDYHASPIEEVTVAAQASDEFGLSDLTLHYSVNGGPEKTVSLLKQKGAKESDGSTTLALEDFKLIPGDLVSVYATAKDARSESRTDMFFIQADPFEREFSQSQMAGGGGGGGGMGGANDQFEISQREKEIIAATWKQQGEKDATKQEIAETAKFLSGVQAKLRDQALSLSGRLEARELSEANQEFSDFQKDMNAAAEAMTPAANKLQKEKWTDAIPDEQKSLQHLLRAEATFRQIQVAFGARGGGGGGGGAGRDLQSLFDLELDTEKNQYETGQTASSSNQQRSQEIDDALQKLDQLARRQDQLAQEQRNAQSVDQRWQQEMLRRQAEELQKQIEQLARNSQQSGQQGGQQQGGQQQRNGQQGGQQGSQQGGQQSGSTTAQEGSSGSGQSAGQSGNGQSQGNATDSRVQQALDQLRQAQNDMARASSPQEGQAAARRAADRLREATDLLSGLQQQQSGQQLSAMAREADRLSNEQRDQAARARQLFGQKGGGNQAGGAGANEDEQAKLGDDREQMAGDLDALEKQMRDTARGLSSTQPSASSKLRDALGEAEQADLENRIRRSAEWMRRGIDPNSDGTEPAVAGGLQRLSDQLRQAQQAVNNNQQGPEDALNRVEQLRGQMETLARGLGSRNPQGGKSGQQGSSGQPGQGQAGQAQPGQAGGPGNQANAGQANGGGPVGGYGPDVRGGYGAGPYNNGYRYGYDAGGYWPQGTERQPSPSSPAEIERAYQDAMRELNELRQSVRGQPDQLADLQDLIRQMQRLDPSRFPGNPAMLQELHDQVLTTVDKLELRLRREVDDKQSGQVRSGDNLPVPDGYQDSVAEYFRRLSNNNKQ